MKEERQGGKKHTCAPQKLWGWVCFVVQDCQADSENIEEATLMQPSTEASLTSKAES